MIENQFFTPKSARAIFSDAIISAVFSRGSHRNMEECSSDRQGRSAVPSQACSHSLHIAQGDAEGGSAEASEENSASSEEGEAAGAPSTEVL